MILRHFILLSLFIVQVLSNDLTTEANNPFLPAAAKKSGKKTGYKTGKQNGYGSKKGSKKNKTKIAFEYDDENLSRSDANDDDDDDDDAEDNDDNDNNDGIPAKKSRKSKKKGPFHMEPVIGKKVRSGVEDEWEYICEDHEYECSDGTIVTRDANHECEFYECQSEDESEDAREDESDNDSVELKTMTINNASTSTSVSPLQLITLATFFIAGGFL
mmetsp:Transcript_23442/g.35577  ORF Transcript_23442/g.35577 Transcript_23442/m.35577 type:complete len:216 (+) Transcript_23442:101-748(+)